MPVLDQFGRPLQAETKAPTQSARTASVRDRWSSYPSSGLTPGKLAGILKSADAGDVSRQSELFEEIEEKDAHISGLMTTRKLAVQGLDWEIMPAGDDAPAQRVADFCSAALQELALDEVILDLMDAVGKGFSVLETKWDQSEGETRIAALEYIHPKDITFLISQPPYYSPYPRLLTEAESTYGIEFPAWKCVYHRYKARSGWASRQGLFRAVSWIYLFKNYAIKDWVGFLEVFAVPLRLGKYPPGASDDDKQALLNALSNLGTDAAAIISAATEIDFRESNKESSSGVFHKALEYFDRQEAFAILGQTLTSQAEATGLGSGVAKEHGKVRDDLVQADAKSLMRTVTAQILRPLVGFNYGWDAPVPQFVLHYEPAEDLAATAAVYKTLIVDMGYPVSVEHMAERFSVPALKAGETPLHPPAQAAPGGIFMPTLAGAPAQPAAAARIEAAKNGGVLNPTEDDVDSIVNKAAGDSASAIREMMGPVEKMLSEAKSLEEFRDQLSKVNAKMSAAPFGRLMQSAMMLAELSGRFSVKKTT